MPSALPFGLPSALVLCALLYVAGVVAGDALRCDEALARTLSLAVLLGFLLVPFRRRLLTPLVLTAAFVVGIWAQSRRPPTWDAGPLPQKESWRCEGQVISVLTSTSSGVSFRLAVERIGPLSGLAPQRVLPHLIVSVSVAGPLADPLLPGDHLRVAASLRLPDGPRNPGASDRTRHYASLGVSAVAFVSSDAILKIDRPFVPPASGSLVEHLQWLELSALRLTARARARLLHLVRGRFSDGERFGLVAALTLGERGPLFAADARRAATGRSTIEASFRAAGIFHILSVSGLHLAVACWAFYHGLSRLLLFVSGLAQRFVIRRLAALCALPAVLFYTLLTGAELPTVRAAVAASLWLLAVACGRRARLIEAVAAAILLIAHPEPYAAPSLLLYDPSLLLSLAATLAIAYLRPLGRLVRNSPSLLRVPLRLCDASLAATLVTLPLCAYYFAEAQPAGVLGNLLAVPIGELVVLPSGLCGAVLSVFAFRWGGLLLELSGAAAALMLRVAERLAAFKLSMTVQTPSVLAIVLWMLGLFLWVMRKRRLGIFLCAGALALYLFASLWPSQELRITFLDVGQGDAAVVELPGAGVIVIDAGPGAMHEGGRDAGDLIVAPFLRRRGHRRIELLLPSHRHPDHIGGLGSLLAQFPVETLWIPPAELGPDAIATLRSKAQMREAATLATIWRDLASVAERQGVRVEAPRSRQLGAVTLEVLSPCAKSALAPSCTVAAQPGFGENDNSLVLRLSYAGRAFLFSGDLELAGELTLLERHDDGVTVAADVLKAPHHCSRTSSSESLVNTVAPTWVICSAGRHNRFGFPHEEVLARYREHGSQILTTGEHGAVTIIVSPDGTLRVDSQALHEPTIIFPLAIPPLQR